METKIPTSVRLSKETLEGLAIIAQRQGTTRHAVMVKALKRAVDDAWITSKEQQEGGTA